jgi:hypothetical protein
MVWPTPQDYNEAVQSARLCFVDEELRQGQVKLNKLGLPRVVTGAFCSVYNVSCGDRRYAVRCFLHEIPDQELRYQRLSKAICNDRLDYTVAFEFQKNGIRVGDSVYPILKMEWVDGTNIDVFVKNSLDDGRKLAQLQANFRQMINDLNAEGFAHGDLQHGNILVTAQGLRLVDYDGMYVPSLSGLLSNELGHRNYQHPKRAREHFGQHLDNFSAWLIDTALTCAIVDPQLCTRAGSFDEAMLFRHSDLQAPEQSKLFFELEKHSNETLAHASRRLRTVLECLPFNVPPLSHAEAVPLAPEHPLVTELREREQRLARQAAEEQMRRQEEERLRLLLEAQRKQQEDEEARRRMANHPKPGWLDETAAAVLSAREVTSNAADPIDQPPAVQPPNSAPAP